MDSEKLSILQWLKFNSRMLFLPFKTKLHRSSITVKLKLWLLKKLSDRMLLCPASDLNIQLKLKAFKLQLPRDSDTKQSFCLIAFANSIA